MSFVQIAPVYVMDYGTRIVFPSLSPCPSAFWTFGQTFSASKPTTRVTVSLWNVPDSETAQLMQQFYQNLWTGKVGHVEGLRSAQLQLWKSGKHPYFWAAFGLQGEWRN
jgi:hypothetical protein